MIKKLLSIAFIFSYIIANSQSFTQTYSFTATTPSTGVTDPTPTSTVTGLTFGSFSAVGTGSASAASFRFAFPNQPLGGVDGVNTYSSMTGSLNTGKYYEVILTPQVGYSVTLSGISFTAQRSGTGIRSYAVRASVDGFANNLPAAIVSNTLLSVVGTNEFFWNLDANSNAQNGSTIILTGSPAFTSSVAIRFYGWNAEAVGGNFGIDNVTFSGSIAAAPTATCAVNASVTAISSDSPICANQPLHLQATAIGDGPLTYSWTGTGTFNSRTVASPTVTGATSGNYMLTVSNACGTATAMVTATVNPLPVIYVNSPTICSGNATLTAGGTASTYTWSTSENTSSIVVSPSSTTTYSLIGTTALGCTGPAMMNATVTIIGSPTLSVNSVTICAGQSATLTASGVSTYTWSNNATTSTIMVSPSTNTVYTVSGEASGCAGVYTNTANVTVNALPILTVTPMASTICAGQTETVTASGATSYTWSTSPAQNTAAATLTPTGTTTYYVYGTSAGCVGFTTTTITVNALPVITVNSATICAGQTATLTASGATTFTWSTSPVQNTASVVLTPTATTVYSVYGTSLTCVNTKTASVTVRALPVITVNSTTICAGQTTTLTASGASTYTWSTSPVQNTANAVVTPTGTTVYSVYGTSLTCVNTKTASVTVNSLPVVTASATNTTICLGQPVTLTGGGATSYAWTGGVTNGTSFTPTTTVSYTVTGTASVTACSAKAMVTVQVNPCTGIDENINSSSFVVFPNPNNGNFTLQSSVLPAVVVVYDITGKQVFSKKVTEMETEVNLSQFESGIYHVMISAENKTANYKIVISK